MKKLKKIYKALLILLIVNACTEERSLDFLENIPAPTNVSGVYNVTQDNTGLVTIIPTAEGASSFDIDFGDASEIAKDIQQGKNVQHTYAEGTYQVKIIAYNAKGDATEASQQLVVSFKAPENLVATIENDASKSRQVNINAKADYAASYEFYSGEEDVTQPVLTVNIGDDATYQYKEAGTYAIRIVAKGAAIETSEYTAEFEVTEILAPTASAATPPSRNAEDVISIYSGAYTNINADVLPDWNQAQFGSSFAEFDLNGDKMLQYNNLSYQGIAFDDNKQDVSNMEFLHIDVWTPDVTKLKTFLINPDTDAIHVTSDLKVDQWTTINIPLSDFTDQGLTLDQIRQFKFESEGPWPIEGTVFVDNIYFWKSPSEKGTPIVFDDFEGNGNISTWFGDDCGMNNNFANPFKDALNNSDTVLEYNDTGGQYANVRFDKDSNFDLSRGNSVFTIKIYVPSSSISGNQPNQLSLKLQDADTNPWERQSEIIKSIALDTWQTVSFDFANDEVLGQTDPLSITNFRRVVLQVNSENNNDTVIAYLDDLSYGNTEDGGGAIDDTAPFVNDDFEGNGTITTWFGDDCGMNNNFANPFKDALNDSDTVLEYNDTGGQYANVRFDISPNYDLTAKSKFSLKIYVPSSSVSGNQPNQISLKLQDADERPWERQSEIIKTINLDTWQEVTFDFANDTVLGQTDPLSITNFNRVVLQVNSENNNDTVIAYIDDLKYFK